MVALLGPILAQMMTLSLSDRTEAREVVSDYKHAEVSTRPAASMLMGWKHTNLTFGYAPSFTLMLPPKDDEQHLLVYHTAFAVLSYTTGRTTLVLNESASYGLLNFRQLTTAPSVAGATASNPNPNPNNPNNPNNGSQPLPIGTVLGGTAPSSGTNNGAVPPTRPVVSTTDQDVRFASLYSSIGFTRAATRNLAYGGDVGYSISGALDAADRVLYPLIHGPRWSAFERYSWGHRDNVTTSAALQYSAVSTGNSAWIASLTETWGHRFSSHTAALIGVGLSGTRSPVPDNGTVVAYGIYPTVNAGLFESTTVARGKLALGFTANAAPAFDLTTLMIDPRVSLGALAGWTRRRFSTSATLGGAFSVGNTQYGNSTNDQDSSVALNLVTGSLTFGYVLGRVVSVDTGVRGAYQTYAGTTVIPLTYAVFAGVNFATIWPFH